MYVQKLLLNKFMYTTVKIKVVPYSICITHIFNRLKLSKNEAIFMIQIIYPAITKHFSYLLIRLLLIFFK